jgi:Mrp family chromosome partitioning ATPase/LPS O-antigen subunit length determinant protein (WzzB/FepE family)
MNRSAEQRLGTIVWRGRSLIAVAVVVSVALALLLTRMSDRVYEATVLLRVDASGVSTAGGDLRTTQEANLSLANTYATVLESRSFLERIAPSTTAGRDGVEELTQRIHSEALLDTSLISLRADGASPTEARRLATEVSSAFIGSIRDDARARIDQSQKEIQERIAAVSEQIRQLGSGEEAAEQLESLRLARQSLTEQLASAFVAGAERTTTVSLAGPPTAPADPIKPRPLLNVLAAIILGAMIGLAVAWARARLDKRVHSAEEAGEALDLPVVAAVPVRARFDPEDPALRNAFDLVHANLAASGRGTATVILVMSAERGDGKTSVARGLAHAAARAGTDVMLVDADLRSRGLTRRLKLESSPGLSEAVADVGAAVETSRLADDVGFLAAGARPSDPASLLHNPGLPLLLADLRRRHDLVVLDAPPAELPDALLLAPYADSVLVVVRAGLTRRASLAKLATALDLHGLASAAGLIVIEPAGTPASYGSREPEEEREWLPFR